MVCLNKLIVSPTRLSLCITTTLHVTIIQSLNLIRKKKLLRFATKYFPCHPCGLQIGSQELTRKSKVQNRQKMHYTWRKRNFSIEVTIGNLKSKNNACHKLHTHTHMNPSILVNTDTRAHEMDQNTHENWKQSLVQNTGWETQNSITSDCWSLCHTAWVAGFHFQRSNSTTFLKKYSIIFA